MVDVPLPGGGGGGGGALALPVEQRWAEGQVAIAGGGGEEDFALVEGDEQQVGGAGEPSLRPVTPVALDTCRKYI